jgi:hypothetical protein
VIKVCVPDNYSTKTHKNIDDLKMAFTEYIRNVERACKTYVANMASVGHIYIPTGISYTIHLPHVRIWCSKS